MRLPLPTTLSPSKISAFKHYPLQCGELVATDDTAGSVPYEQAEQDRPACAGDPEQAVARRPEPVLLPA